MTCNRRLACIALPLAWFVAACGPTTTGGADGGGLEDGGAADAGSGDGGAPDGGSSDGGSSDGGAGDGGSGDGGSSDGGAGDGGAASEEDCTDGFDNDRDGKTDCEDEDCYEECIEDCSDGIDNDRDGDVDCDDDECLGSADCEATYEMTLTVTPAMVFAGWGSALREDYGEDGLLIVRADVEVSGTPSDGSGGGFDCTGSVYDRSGFFSYGSLSWVSSSEGTNLFSWEPDTARESLVWDRSPCPIDALPSAYLSFTEYYAPVFRYGPEDGSWFVQYYTPDYDMRGSSYGSSTFYYTYMANPTAYYSIHWTASL